MIMPMPAGWVRGSLAVVVAVAIWIAWAVAAPSDVRAQSLSSTDGGRTALEDIDADITLWRFDLERIEQVGAYAALDPLVAERNREIVRDIVVAARETAASLEAVIAPLQAQLDALGPKGDSESTDPYKATRPSSEIADQREQLSARIAELETRRRQAEAVSQRAATLVDVLIETQRASLIDRLGHAGPFPWAPKSMSAALSELPAVAQRLIASPQVWWSSLRPEQRDNRTRQGNAAIFLLIVLAAAMVARRWLVRRYGRDPAIAEPGYARRLSAAVIEAGGGGVVPAIVILIVVAFLGRDGALLDGVFADAIIGGLSALALYMAAHSTLEALLSPQAPAWALMSVPGGHDGGFVFRGRLLAALLAIDVGVSLATRSMFVSEPATVTFAAIMTLTEAIAIWLVVDRKLWGIGQDDDDTVDDLDAADAAILDGDEEAAAARPRFEYATWMYVRRIAQIVVVISVAAQLGGYTELGRFLIENTMLTFGVVAIVVLVRGVLRETVGVLSRSRLARRRMGLSVRATRRMKFWVRAILDPILIVAAIYVILPLWGVPRDMLAALAGAVTSEMALGSVVVSPVAIVTAVLAFFIIMAVIRLLRGRFLSPILTEARVDPGAREAISTGVGYVGVIVALLMAVTVAGFDLTNLAIVAGALSVGIGFGLQGIVNNFLSGLILLVERPIKVGDWIIVGEIEGFVKDINFRATEIETWQLASVMVPNGDVISTAVTNWTYRNKRARVDVQFGVSYEADLERAREIVLECARAHPRVLANPAPHVLFMNHEEDRAQMELRAFTGDAIWMMWTASDLRFSLTSRLREEGISMPLPRRIIHTEDPDPASAGQPPAPVATD